MPHTRERRRAEVHQKLLDQAFLIAESDGFEGLTMHRLAADTGYTVGALYRYFDSHTALIAAMEAEVVHAYAADVEGRLSDVAQHHVPSPLHAIGVVVSVLIDSSTRHPMRLALVGHLLAQPRWVFDAETAAPIATAGLALFGRVVVALAEAPLKPGDATSRAVTLLAALIGVLQTRKLALYVPTWGAESAARDVVSDLLCAWGADPHAVAHHISPGVSL